MELKRNVVMLPTNQRANLAFNQINSRLLYDNDSTIDRVLPHCTYQHLYILSDEEIKEGDWVIPNDKNYANRPWKYSPAPCPMPYWGCADNCKKIIATTDKSPGLPSPSPEFVQAYIKSYNAGNPITEVMVEYEDDIRYEQNYNKAGFAIGVPHNKNYGIKLKANKDNCIIITRVKDNWNKEELDVILNDFASAALTAALHGTLPSDAKHFTKQWTEQNL